MATAAPPKFPGVQPRHHDPSGEPSWPRVLISGEEGAHKSWTLAEFTADPRLAGTFWLEIGSDETTAEEYGIIPGANYQIVDHDGTFSDIYQQLCVHWHAAKAAEERGEVIALAIDSMSGEWDMLQAYGDLKARRREAEKLKRNKEDPALAWSLDYEVTIGSDIWTFLRKKRHELIMSVVKTWPGPVAYTARETLAVPFGADGNPVAKADKLWSLQSQKTLGFASTVWVRMTRQNPPEIVKLRSAKLGISVMPRDEADAATTATARKAKDRSARPWKNDHFTLSELTFDIIGCVVGQSRAPKVIELDADQDMPDDSPPVTLTAGELANARNKARLGANQILNAESAAAADHYVMAARTTGLGGYDISEVLTDGDRETLALPDGEVSLLALAETTAKYWKHHKTGPRTLLDAEPAEKAVA